MLKQKPDGNKSIIVDALRKSGAYVITMDARAGFDCLVIHQGKIYIMEIKQPMFQNDLTPNEYKRMLDVMEHDAIYFIVTTPEEALKMIGRG